MSLARQLRFEMAVVHCRPCGFGTVRGRKKGSSVLRTLLLVCTPSLQTRMKVHNMLETRIFVPLLKRPNPLSLNLTGWNVPSPQPWEQCRSWWVYSAFHYVNESCDYDDLKADKQEVNRKSSDSSLCFHISFNHSLCLCPTDCIPNIRCYLLQVRQIRQYRLFAAFNVVMRQQTPKYLMFS